MIARRSPALSALSGAMLAAVSCFACFPASAQPLIVRVNPRLAQQGVLMFGNEPGTIQTLFDTGPRYSDPSGVRVGRGSQIPGWLELGSGGGLSFDPFDAFANGLLQSSPFLLFF